MADSAFLSRSYDAYALIEEQFNDALDQSLDPRGPDMLYDLVSSLALSPGALALDIGCGEGRHAIELANRFRLSVLGVDPVARHIGVAALELSRAAHSNRSLAGAVRFEIASAERLSVQDRSVDLIWCRDVLVHIFDLSAVYTEFRRVLKPDGRALVYQMFVTDRLEPREAAWLLPTMGCIAENMRPEYAETAIRAAGLKIDKCLVLGSEWGEYGQENTGKGSRKLLHASRLLREPDRYLQQYGKDNYEIALGDCLWHVYRLIGKLSDRVYLLSPQDP